MRGKNHRPADAACSPQMCDRNDLLTLGELLEPLLLAIGWAAFGYQLTPDTKLYVVTEWNRSATTVMLPEDY